MALATTGYGSQAITPYFLLRCYSDPVAAPIAPGRRIEADRRREGVRETEQAGTAAPGGVSTDAAYLLASSSQDYEAIAVMMALTRFLRICSRLLKLPGRWRH